MEHNHLTCLTLLLFLSSTTRASLPGAWELLVQNAGIASMHTAVTHHGTVVLLDRTNIGPSQLHFPIGHKCRFDKNDAVLKRDCYAHSVLFNPENNEIRPLTILTDTWCSSGQFLPNGTLLQTGGDLDGLKKIRMFHPCDAETTSCDWLELEDVELEKGRWYASNQILPDGSVIVVGGRRENTVEFFPTRGKAVALPFLAEAEDVQMDNLYPYLHLLPNGLLFIFANDKAVAYDYNSGDVVVRYPALEGGPRNYPSAGSSVMLAVEGDFTRGEIVVCGGAEYGVFLAKRVDAAARGSCGRIVATEENAVWKMEDMPFRRTMGDMVMLPTGHVLIINGAQSGSQGFEMGSDPCLNPVLYRPAEPAGLRFMTLNPTTVPRMYHSTANLLPDGRVLVAGSNPHYMYKLKAEFPTELRIEAFSPEYLSADRANLRPTVVTIPERVRYGEAFEVRVTVELPVVEIMEVNMASAPFATHSFSQGQRLVKLTVGSAMADGGGYRIGCTGPLNGRVAPPGYYMVFVVNQGVPSVARWVQLLG
ncbi:unnamed protein product [Rhodiola kirilowii]